jgi:CRP/FNR family cyclic AMP-dependent transcriptional regulator
MTMDLCDCPVFKGLNPTQTRNFTSACTMRDYSAGTEIITKGRHGNTLFFLLEGQLKVFIPQKSGNQILAEFQPPAIFGEMELLTERPRIASVVAVTDVKVAVIPFDVVHMQIRDGDTATLKVMFNVATIIANRLEAINDKLLEIATTTKNGVQSQELLNFQKKLFSEWSF